MTIPKQESLPFVAYGGLPVMPRQIIRRETNYPPNYDAIEVLMIAAGAVLIVAIAFVF
jgi:hypothetical protein